MKDEDVNSEFIEELISMLPYAIPDYTSFYLNPSKDIINDNYTMISESAYNKNLSDIKNFAIKTEEEFYIFTFCIMSQIIIKFPARTKNCKHYECIEARDLFKYVIKNGVCPLCLELSENDDRSHCEKIGVDSIYIDKKFQEIFDIATNNLPNGFGFGFDLIIFNKYNSKWRPFLPDIASAEYEILVNSVSEKFSNIGKFNEQNKNYSELLDMNRYIGEENENDMMIQKNFIQISLPKGE